MKITFQPYTPSNQPLMKPVPASKILPDWYKKMSPYTDGNKPKYFLNGQKNLTIKRCNPVGDAFLSGYFLVLQSDVSITPGETPGFVWNHGGPDLISEHGVSQIDKELIPEGFGIKPWKFQNDWSIQTPKGYSVLITHPFNRNAEPFLTLSGVVDTDTYHQAINLPFFLRQDFEGILEAGTPIAQVIPFKRESWQANFTEHDGRWFQEKRAEFTRIMNRYYKRFHWKRKEYK